MNNEETIEILKSIKRPSLSGTFDKQTERLKAIDTVLNYIEELEKREIWSTATMQGLKNDFIPKQKLRDKIEEIEKEMKHEANDTVLVWLHKQRKVLKELLEEEK